MFAFLKDALSGDNGASSRRLGYIISIITLCLTLLTLCGYMGYLVIGSVPLDVITTVLPQIRATFEMISGMVITAVTTGYIMKKTDDGSSNGK